MRTRTLLILAIVCGVVILVAGGVQLVRLTDQQQTSLQLAQGEEGRAGDARVTLTSVAVDDAVTTARVTIGGVDDPAGLDGFTLVGVGVVARLDVAATSCTAITVAAQQCDLVFATADFPAGARQLLFRRADTQLRWVLAAG